LLCIFHHFCFILFVFFLSLFFSKNNSRCKLVVFFFGWKNHTILFWYIWSPLIPNFSFDFDPWSLTIISCGCDPWSPPPQKKTLISDPIYHVKSWSLIPKICWSLIPYTMTQPWAKLSLLSSRWKYKRGFCSQGIYISLLIW